MSVTPSEDSLGTARLVRVGRDLVVKSPGSAEGWTSTLDLLMHRVYLQGVAVGRTLNWDTLQITITPNSEGEGLRVTAEVEVF